MLEIKPIGTIHSPHKTIENMPIQPKGALGLEGFVLLNEEYTEGLKDLDGFSHIYLIYSLHKAKKTELIVTPFMDTEPRGIFSTRSPARPNHIGISILKLKRVDKNKVFVENIDILDGSPLLDIKPYIQNFDEVKESKSGWMKGSLDEVKNKRSDDRFE